MADITTIPQRSELDKAYTWAIEDLYPTDEAWQEDLRKVEALTRELGSYKGKLMESPHTLLTYMQKLEEMRVLSSNLGNYCSRKGDEDTRVSKYQALKGQFSGAEVALDEATSFETPEVMALSDAEMEAFYTEEPQLERFRRYLSDIRRRKDHILSPAEEKLLAAAGGMSDTPSNVFGLFNNADITFEDAVDSEGVRHPLSQGTFVAMEESEDRVLRESAFRSLYKGFGAFRNTMAATLAGQVKQLKFFADARKYPDSMTAALDVTNVPTSVYTNLIEAVHNNLDKMHHYVRLRKKMLGVDELHFYDVYAPLVKNGGFHIPFEDAKVTVYNALEPLGDNYRKILQSGFDNRWIDVYPNVGKRGGAYSAGARVHPYVLLNYTGTLASQFTLAHEMGHAMHSYFSNHTQNPLDAGYKIFVAEVASTCNEALLMQYLLKNCKSKEERIPLINRFLEQFKGTLYRQTMFAEFERNIGRMYQEGKTLTAEVLCQEYRRLNALYFGPDMVIDDEIAMEWARIPHFYYNYYVFQYATGYSAAIALSRRILKEGESAVEDYLNFLRGGCSKSPIDLLRGAGVDMASPEPVNQALQLFGELLDEMEELIRQ